MTTGGDHDAHRGAAATRCRGMTEPREPVEVVVVATREGTAVHEAGHAVVALRLRRRVGDLSIAPFGDALGTCAIWVPTGGNPLDPTPRKMRAIRDAVVICLAGSAAEIHGQEGTRNLWSADDYEMAEKLAESVGGSNALVRWGQVRACNLVERHWVEIEAVATELLKSTTLLGSTARLIANAARVNPQKEKP